MKGQELPFLLFPVIVNISTPLICWSLDVIVNILDAGTGNIEILLFKSKWFTSAVINPVASAALLQKKPSVESNPSDIEAPDYIHKGIARRSFDMGWKVSPKFDLTKINATMANGLLKVVVPVSEDSKPKAVTIK